MRRADSNFYNESIRLLPRHGHQRFDVVHDHLKVDSVWLLHWQAQPTQVCAIQRGHHTGIVCPFAAGLLVKPKVPDRGS